jgi:hypothetical protein
MRSFDIPQTSVVERPLTSVQWWSQARKAANFFYKVVEAPPVNADRKKVEQIIAKLEETRNCVEVVDTPFEAYHARSYLLAAITDFRTGLVRLLSGETSIGHAYIRAAQIEVGFLEQELDDLSIRH